MNRNRIEVGILAGKTILIRDKNGFLQLSPYQLAFEVPQGPIEFYASKGAERNFEWIAEPIFVWGRIK